MYNQSYIDDFENTDFKKKQNVYSKYLNNPNLLKKLAEEYSRKYGPEADAFYLALKESLDHYVAKKISENKQYINTIEFRNYANYLAQIIKENNTQIGNSRIYLEPSTNVVFEYLDDETLNKIWPGNTLKKHIEYNDKIINSLILKLENNDRITGDEVKFLSKYFDNKKQLDDNKYKKFLSYIFKNLKSISASPELISSILSYLPRYYGEQVENSRAFLATYDSPFSDRKKPINWAHSSGIMDYTCFQYDKFKDVKLDSYKSVDTSRGFNERDILFLIFVEFHELSHQRQRIQMNNENSMDATAYEANKFLNDIFKDYVSDRSRNFEGNHDSDEVEIDADERGWRKCRSFVLSMFERSDEQLDIARKCAKNEKAVNCRRAFTVKQNPEDRSLKRYMDYDMSQLLEAVRRYPEKLKNYPHISKFISEDGKIKVDFLFEQQITVSPFGREISNYIFNNAPVQLLVDKVNSKKYNINQVKTMLENLVQVPHANALAVRELKNIDLNTYDGTQTKYRIKENLNKVHNNYFLECSKQLLKFTQILSNACNSYKGQFSQEEVNSYYKYFAEYYYKEMLEQIESPESKLIQAQMDIYKKSGNPYLAKLADYTMEIVAQKTKSKRNLQGIGIDNDDIYGIEPITTQMSDLRVEPNIDNTRYSESDIGRGTIDSNTSMKDKLRAQVHQDMKKMKDNERGINNGE